MFILLYSRSQRRLIAGAMLLCLSSPALAAEYTFRKVANVTGASLVYGVSLNDHEATTFSAALTDGSYTYLATTPAGNLVTIASSAQGYHGLDPSSGRPSINNSNTVAFLASTDEYPFPSIYRSFSFGEPIVFQQVGPGPGGISSLRDPWISNSNGVVYIAGLRGTPEDPVDRTALMRGSLPVVTDPTVTTSFGDPDINSIDSVVAVGSDGLYLNSNIVYQHSGSTASINDSGTVAFLSDDYGPLGIYTGDGVSTAMLYASSQGGTAMGHPDINNSGLIAYIDRTGGGAETIFVGTGHERLLANSFVGGDPVGRVTFFRGLNNHGQIAFAYSHRHDQSGFPTEWGIAIASPRDASVLGNGDFNNGWGLFQLINDTNDSFASVKNVAGDLRLEMTAVDLVDDGVISVRQRMETTGDPYLLQFDFDWLTTAGSLEVHINDIMALTLGADGSVSSEQGSPTILRLGDLNRLSLEFTPAPLADGYIRLDLHPGSEATIQIDNISFAPIPRPTRPGDYNGNGLVEQADLDLVLTNWGADAAAPPDGWVQDLPIGIIDQGELDSVLAGWGSSPASALTAVPEPSSVMLLSLCGFAIVGFVMDRRPAAKGANPPGRPSFFGLPHNLRFISWSGFWGGVPVGVSIGLLLCLLFVELQVITPRPGEWTPEVSVPIIAMFTIGVAIAAQAVRRSRGAEQTRA